MFAAPGQEASLWQLVRPEMDKFVGSEMGRAEVFSAKVNRGCIEYSFEAIHIFFRGLRVKVPRRMLKSVVQVLSYISSFITGE